MTRKQALLIAFETIQDENAKEVIHRLIKDFPWHEWTEAAIFDAIDQFVLEKGRPPTPTDFKYNNLLPQGATVQNRFGITLSEFLKKYYPKKVESHIYYNKTKEEWLSIFKDIYKINNPKSANEYNKLRPKDTPTWWVFAHMFGLSKWNELLSLVNISTARKRQIRKRAKESLEVISHSDLD